ncbi:platelet glycoprotein IX-like [Ambystoma mexicanum]|uniref:platelet glycoprotein IX-like n=1 Tax=Ambystoma mexicanum TaxID=8296 RepID=UPI0037E83445
MFKAKPSTVGLLSLWFLAGIIHGDICPLSCICTTIEQKGMVIDCSSRRLHEVPDLPHNTIKLYLQNNSLTTVPAGHFDNLPHLLEVDLSSNPWICDCQILYLKLWLEDQHLSLNHGEVRCMTPATAWMKPLNKLTGNELIGCRTPWPISCHEFFGRDLVLIILALLVLVLMSIAVWVAKRMSCSVAMYEEFPSARLLQRYNTDNFKLQ